MTLERVARGQARGSALALRRRRSIIVAGTNGKGSTCAMLESIALRRRLPRRAATPSRTCVHFDERCRDRRRSGRRPTRCCRTSRPSRRRAATSALTYFEFTTLAILRLLAAARARPGDPRGRPGRPPRRGQRLRRRLRRPHQHRHRPRRVPRHRPRDASAARRPASCAPASRPIVSDPLPPQQRDRRMRGAIGADLWLLGRDFNYAGDRQQWSWAGRGQRFSGLAYPALRGANQLLNAVGRAGRARGAARAPAGQRAGGAQRAWRWSSCRAASRCCPAGRRWSSTSPTTRTPWPRWRGTSTRWASSRAPTRCSARCATRTSPRILAAHGAAGRRLALHRPADAARRRAPTSSPPALATRAGPRRGRGRQHATPTPGDGAAPRPGPRQTPLIESSSSAPSTPWVACSRRACRAGPAATPADAVRTRPGSAAIRSKCSSRRATPPPHGQVESADAVQHARTRARQRLIGAIVLLAIGIIGFPLRVRDAAAADAGRHPDRDSQARRLAAADAAAARRGQARPRSPPRRRRGREPRRPRPGPTPR